MDSSRNPACLQKGLIKKLNVPFWLYSFSLNFKINTFNCIRCRVCKTSSVTLMPQNIRISSCKKPTVPLTNVCKLCFRLWKTWISLTFGGLHFFFMCKIYTAHYFLIHHHFSLPRLKIGIQRVHPGQQFIFTAVYVCEFILRWKLISSAFFGHTWY